MGAVINAACTGNVDQIEAEARKEPPLCHTLWFFGFAFCPVWISTVVVTVAELSFPSLPANFYSVANSTVGAGSLLTLDVAIFRELQARRRWDEATENIGRLSSYQSGIDTIKVALGDWVYWIAAIPLAMYFLIDTVAGGGGAQSWQAQLSFGARKNFSLMSLA